MRLIIITLVLLGCGCNPKSNGNHKIAKSIDSISLNTGNNQSNKDIDPKDMNGIWELSFYPDSCIIDKKIFKYSLSAASIAYQIVIENSDSCLFIGYHESWYSPLRKIDSITYQTTEDNRDYFTLKFLTENNSIYLYLDQYSDAKKINIWGTDRHKNKFNKTDKKIDSIEDFLVANLFVGTYKDKITNKEVKFTSDFKILGSEKFNHYKVVLDWEDNLAPNDAIYLTNIKNQNEAANMFYWEIKDNNLIIKKLEILSSVENETIRSTISDVVLDLEKIN